MSEHPPTETTSGTGELRTVALSVAALALLPAVFDMSSTYYAGLLHRLLLFATLAVALNIVFGHTDQLFLFLGGLAGVGAYTTVLLADSLGVEPWLVFPLSGIAAGAMGLVVSYVAARRRMTVIVIAILTLSIQLALHEIFVGARDITGGSTGVSFDGFALPPVDLLGVSPAVATYYTILAFLAGVLLLYWRLRNSRYGLAFRAIRQDEVASEAAGVDVIRYKVVAGVLAAAIIGLTGALYAHAEGYVFPSLFTFKAVDVIVLIMLVLGGIRTITGPLLGAALVVALNELLQGVGQWRTAVLGALLIVLFLFFREGMVPQARDALAHERVRTLRRTVSDWRTGD